MQDKRFNIKVDMNTLSPVIFYPMFSFDQTDLVYKHYGVI